MHFLRSQLGKISWGYQLVFEATDSLNPYKALAGYWNLEY